MSETTEDKAALFTKFVKADPWDELHLINAVAEVYKQHDNAAADEWTIHEKLVAKLYDETTKAWAKRTGENSHAFPWNVDTVAEAYESHRKAAKSTETAFKPDPAKFMSLLLLCVLRVFIENTNADKENPPLWESRKARSDTWARNSVLREELIARVIRHWTEITGQPHYAFPWNATIVGRTYLVIRKTKKELDPEIDKRRMQLEMFHSKKFKGPREALNKRRQAAETDGSE